MAFALKPEQPIRRRLKDVVRQQLRLAETSLGDDRTAGVHEARKSVKKVRALVALLQEADAGALGKDARRLRAVGHAIAPLRDADAAISTFDRLRAHFPKRLPEHTHAMLRRRLVRAKTRALSEARADRTLARAAHALHTVRRSAKGWRVPAIDAHELPNLLKASYRAGRKAMGRAHDRMTPADLHQWRKRVKTLWYHLRLAEPLAPGLRSDVRRLDQLETRLGEDHNLSMLQVALTKDDDLARRVPGALRELRAMSTAVQAKLRQKTFALGKRLFADRPKAFARRLRRAISGNARATARKTRHRKAA